MPETAAIIVATDTGISASGGDMAGIVRAYLTACLPGDGIDVAVSTADRESLTSRVDGLIGDGARRIILLFVSGGRQTAGVRVEELRRQYSDATFHVASAPPDAAGIAELLTDSLEEFSPEVYGDLAVTRVKPANIEAKSMALIELLPGTDKYTGASGEVLKRMVHATGDGSIAKSIRIHRDAVGSALKAIGAGSVIVTDSRMTSAGINRAVSDGFGCRIYCALDAPEIATGAEKWGLTRSAAGMRLLAGKLPGAIVVIGNAPTALVELLRLAREDAVVPAVIIGIPVGFVQAREAKMALMRQTVPYVTVAGNRGGSALASAALNALRILAEKTSGVGN